MEVSVTVVKINQDVWNEFILWAHVVLYDNPEADLYDLFMRIRLEHGNQPFSANFLTQVDGYIAADERREAKKLAKAN